MVMVDLHCHLLPGIDDGSKSMEISLRLAKEATENPLTSDPCSVLFPEQVIITFPNGSICDIIISSFMRTRIVSILGMGF